MPDSTHSIASHKDGVRTVFGNAGALLAIQIANQLLPFILVPYLTHVLGADIYGVVSFGLAIVQAAAVVTDYGFNLSATLQISQHRSDTAYVNQLIGAVFLNKAVLLLLVSAAVTAYALLNAKYAAYSSFLLLLCLPLAGQTFLPLWFFQGIEKMVYITVFTVVSRLAYLVMVFTLVSAASDYVWLALANGASQIIAVILAMILMLKEGYRPAWPALAFTKEVMQKSTEFFLSRAAVSTYTAGGAIFLGLTSTPIQVAYYAAADQLYKGAQSLFAPLAQALYPNMARTRNFALLFRTVKWATLLCVLGGIVGAVIGRWFISFLFGPAFMPSYTILLVFLVSLTVTTPSVLLGYPLLGALGQARVANFTVLVAGAVQVLLLAACFIFKWNQAFDVAWTVLAVEAIVLALRVRWGRFYHRNWLKTVGRGG